MKRLWVSMMALLFSWGSFAVSLNQVVVFGDSLSDNGNLYEYMKHRFPPSPPYYQGRFSNGPVWVEHLLTMYYHDKAPAHLLDYAFGGAGVSTPDNDDVLFTLNREVDAYLLAHHDQAEASSLFVIWIGANNYLALQDEVAQGVTMVNEGIKTNLERLIAKGAKQLLVINLPDVSQSPVAKIVDDADTLAYLHECSVQHNAQLHLTAEAVQAQHPDVHVIYFDANAMVAEVLKDPAKAGFSNTTDTCLPMNSPSPVAMHSMLTMTPHALSSESLEAVSRCEGYVFFDLVHPTTLAHQRMAERLALVLEKEGITFTKNL